MTMIHHQHSSGNLVADKRAQYARLCADAQDFETAIDVLQQALELEPLWASGWFALGEYSEKSNKLDAAHTAYTHALHLSSTDQLGAALKIAYLENEPVNAVPLAYTEALFDSYADRFDESLVQGLKYQAPQILTKLLLANCAEQWFSKAVDLGCGTGLMAAQLRAQIGHLTGVDMSALMVAKANEKRLYDRLIKSDFNEALPQLNEVNLVVSADVFIYAANLEPVFNLVFKSLANNGMFLFSVEAHLGNAPWMLRQSLRHAHSAHYVEALLSQLGFALVAKQVASIRFDSGEPVAGLFYLAQK